jgi:hypothetical protein
MKINLKNVPTQMLLIFGVLSLLSVAFLIYKSCNKPDVDPVTQKVQELTEINRQQQIAFDHYRDSSEKAVRAKDSTIRRDSISLARSQSDVRKSTAIASYYARRYDSAKQALDTTAQLEYGDSLRWEIATVNQEVDDMISKTTVLVGGLYDRIDGLVIDLSKAHQRIDQQNSTIVQLNDLQKPLVVENQALKKQLKSAKRWGNRKMVLGAGIGAAIRGLFK